MTLLKTCCVQVTGDGGYPDDNMSCPYMKYSDFYGYGEWIAYNHCALDDPLIYFGCDVCATNDPNCKKCKNSKSRNIGFTYCERCDFLFDPTHVYQSNGCERDNLFYKYISKYMYKGVEYSGSPKLKHNFEDVIFNSRNYDEEPIPIPDTSNLEVKLCLPSGEVKLNHIFDEYGDLILSDIYIKEVRCSCLDDVENLLGKKASFPIDKYPQHYENNCSKIYKY